MGKLNCKNFVLTKMPKGVAQQQGNKNVEGLSIGINKGFVVSKNIRRARPVSRKGKMSTRVANITKTIKSVAGFSPHEKRSIEMYKVGNSKVDKRANRFLRKRLGSIKRSKKKSEILQNFVKKQKEKK